MTNFLSFAQESVLRMASDQKPIYVESYDFNKSAPEGRIFFGSEAMITFRSLVKRGLLIEDGRSGYLITASGLETLKTARKR